MLLEGKKALVTGARRGIGRAIAVALARDGCDVGINDRELDAAARETEEMVAAAGRRALLLQADVGSPADVQAMAKKHLDPKKLTIVAVGAIDKDGKSLKKKK